MLLKNTAIFFVKLYKSIVSPALGARCRFYPCCSSYALEAIEKFGCRKGIKIALKRILRCNVFIPGGFDPVPGKMENIK